jgi:hypothetical protein
MNGIAKGVRQLRGTSVNQVSDVEHVLVTAGTGVPTSGLVLGLDFNRQCGKPQFWQTCHNGPRLFPEIARSGGTRPSPLSSRA